MGKPYTCMSLQLTLIDLQRSSSRPHISSHYIISQKSMVGVYVNILTTNRVIHGEWDAASCTKRYDLEWLTLKDQDQGH